MEKFDRFINEAANDEDNLIQMEGYNVYVNNDDEILELSVGKDSSKEELGYIEAQPLDNCSKVWYISDVKAQQGWGPFLYDLAIAYCSMGGREGLTADKYVSTTEPAFKVWHYYYHKRTDDSERGDKFMKREITQLCSEKVVQALKNTKFYPWCIQCH